MIKQTVDLCLFNAFPKKIGGFGHFSGAKPFNSRGFSLKFFHCIFMAFKCLKSLSAIEVWLHQPWCVPGTASPVKAHEISWELTIFDVFFIKIGAMTYETSKIFFAQRLWPNNYSMLLISSLRYSHGAISKRPCVWNRWFQPMLRLLRMISVGCLAHIFQDLNWQPKDLVSRFAQIQ